MVDLPEPLGPANIRIRFLCTHLVNLLCYFDILFNILHFDLFTFVIDAIDCITNNIGNRCICIDIRCCAREGV